jgi:hypothetical protein
MMTLEAFRTRISMADEFSLLNAENSSGSLPVSSGFSGSPFRLPPLGLPDPDLGILRWCLVIRWRVDHEGGEADGSRRGESEDPEQTLHHVQSPESFDTMDATASCRNGTTSDRPDRLLFGRVHLLRTRMSTPA